MKLKELSFWNLSFLIAGGLGLVGVLGESAILYNSLVHSYPYKLMDMPPAEFYRGVGTIGYYVSIVSALIAFVVLPVPRFLLTAVPVAVCPIGYWLTFQIAHVTYGFSSDQMLERNFDRYTGQMAQYEFGYEVLMLLLIGTGVGLVCGFIIERLAAKSIQSLS